MQQDVEVNIHPVYDEETTHFLGSQFKEIVVIVHGSLVVNTDS